jgi:hypothetical protein
LKLSTMLRETQMAPGRAPSCAMGGLVFGWLALVLATAAVAHGAHAQSRAVRVTREEPVVTRTDVDPLRRPANAPVFDSRESGLCRATFEVRTSVEYSLDAGSRKSIRLIPTAIEVVTHLKLDIFTLAGGSPKLHAHEEAHRQISEHYYENAATVARTLAEPLIGKPITGTGATRAAAEKNAFDRLVKAYNESYFERTRSRAAAANARFDEITDHGRNAVAEADALARSLAPDPPGL